MEIVPERRIEFLRVHIGASRSLYRFADSGVFRRCSVESKGQKLADFNIFGIVGYVSVIEERLPFANRRGYLHLTGGTLHPLKFALGLAGKCVAIGVKLYGDTEAVSIRREGKSWQIGTSEGAITADRLLVATNAYTNLAFGKLKRSIIPLFSYQVSTAPLDSEQLAGILPQGHGVSDSRRLLRYFRKGPGDRLIIGGRGAFTDTPQMEQSGRLRRYLRGLYPVLRDVDFDHCWGGRVAMTPSHIPHLLRLGPGAFSLLGFNGFGVALSTHLGSHLGEKMLSDERGLKLPITNDASIALHRFHPIPVRALIGSYDLADRAGFQGN